MWTQKNRPRYDRDHLRYPSDLTDEEWAVIAPLIPPPRPGGGKRRTDMRAVVNGLMYILSTGCQWRYIPKDFPPRSTVYNYFVWWQCVSGFPPPPCNARAARHDAAHIRDVESHIWSTIWLKLRDHGAGSMSRSERGGGVGGAMKPRAGSWRNPMRRARSCRRWRAGTTSRRSICSLGARRHAAAC